jgi:5-methyltetrahydrofolate--homocysteine methyltransferase
MKNSAHRRLRRVLAERILVFDGAMGTMIQAYRPQESDFRGEQFREHPRDLRGCNDLEAGADILETNTFNANAISMSDYGMESQVYAMNRAAAEIARRLADEYSRKEAGAGASRRPGRHSYGRDLV